MITEWYKDEWTAIVCFTHSFTYYWAPMCQTMLSIEWDERSFSRMDSWIWDFIQFPSPAKGKTSSSNPRAAWATSTHLQPREFIGGVSQPPLWQGWSHIPEWGQVLRSPHIASISQFGAMISEMVASPLHTKHQGNWTPQITISSIVSESFYLDLEEGNWLGSIHWHS